MGRDPWVIVSAIGAALACLACVTPLAVVGLGALGLGAWAGHLDLVLLPVLVVLVGVAIHRYRAACRRTT